jgi:hypothetical protein
MVRTWAVDEGMDPAIAEPVGFASGQLDAVGTAIAAKFAAIITG